MRKLSVLVASVLALVVSMFGVITSASIASASGANPDVVGAVPAAYTPWIRDGQVLAITQVGSTMIVGGNFTQVSPPNAASGTTSTSIVAFDAATGTINSAFNPRLNGEVDALLAGPNNTVYVGGAFTSAGGQTVYRVTQLNVADGSIVAAFSGARFNAAVNSLKIADGLIWVGGYFTAVGTVAHGGLAAINPTTGALSSVMNVQLSGHHGTSTNRTSVGVRAMDVSPDGRRLITVGNFTTADGLNRQQVAMIDISSTTATLDQNWSTTDYTPQCFSNAFDSTVRGVAFSPDGSYLAIAATGGYNAGTLCDTTSRFETNAVGTDLHPTWSDVTGGDTPWSVAITNTAVYVGGHFRWENNSQCGDRACEGAVPRPGVTALDPINGVPYAWNPGRNPRGAGAYALYVSPTGLWVGSDTEWIGNHKYHRDRIAYFPYSGGYNLPSTNTGSLPGTVYLGAGHGTSNVMYRVDSGGPALASLDSGPDWLADGSDTDPGAQYRNTGSNAASWPQVPSVNSSVPSSTPSAVFNSERWDPADSNEMQSSFPVAAGTHVEVRLYFANRCGCTSGVGQRVFNVSVDGSQVLTNYDIVADAGDQTGEMKAFDVTAPASNAVTISFGHVTENPLVDGIEIVNLDRVVTPPTSSVSTISFDGSTAGAPQAGPTGGIDWTTVRGAFMLGSKLYFGDTINGTPGIYESSFDGSTYGTPALLDPYHDPVWDGVYSGSGGQNYDGVYSSFYSEVSNVTGMFYSGGRIYYTQSGSSNLYYRYFEADSGITGSDEFIASGGLNWSTAGGMFINGSTLYFVNRSTGALWSVPFTNGAPSGTPTDVNDPATGGDDWRANAVFIGPSPAPNRPPVASFSYACPNLTCSFDGSASYDPDGSVASYGWNFGDGQTATGPTPTHTYATNGTYTVTLTVTDNRGATGRQVRSVVASNPSASPIRFVGSNGSDTGVANPSVTLPAGLAAGNTLVLIASVNSSTTTPSSPSGSSWTVLPRTDAGGMATYAWYKTATTSDIGGRVTVPFGKAAQVSLEVAAYANASSTAPIDVFGAATDTATSSHATPTVQVQPGDWVLSYWADKSSTTTHWTGPSGLSERDSRYSTASGRITSLLDDSGAAVPGGPYGGQVATTNQAGAKAIMLTIALTP